MLHYGYHIASWDRISANLVISGTMGGYAHLILHPCFLRRGNWEMRVFPREMLTIEILCFSNMTGLAYPYSRAKWSKVLLLTSHCLSRLSQTGWGACEKVVSILGLGSCFLWVLRFPPPLTTGKAH